MQLLFSYYMYNVVLVIMCAELAPPAKRTWGKLLLREVYDRALQVSHLLYYQKLTTCFIIPTVTIMVVSCTGNECEQQSLVIAGL